MEHLPIKEQTLADARCVNCLTIERVERVERVEGLISTLTDVVGETQVIKRLGFRNSATKFKIIDEIKRQFQEYQR